MSLILSMFIGVLVYISSFNLLSLQISSHAGLYQPLNNSVLLAVASLGSGFLVTIIVGAIFERNFNKKSFLQSIVILVIVGICFYFSDSYNYINSHGITEKSTAQMIHYSLGDVNQSVLNNVRVRRKNQFYFVLIDQFNLKNGKVYRYFLNDEESLKQAIQIAKSLPPSVKKVVTPSSIDQLSSSINVYDYNQNEKRIAKQLFDLYSN